MHARSATSRPNPMSMPQVRETAASWLLVPALYCLLSLALLNFSYNLFHFSVETACVVIGVMALLVANISRRFTSGSLLIIASSGLGWCALLDFLHVMTYEGMGLLQGSTTDLATQLWIIGRMLQALVLLAAVLLMDKAVGLSRVHLACALFTLSCLGLLYAGYFPAAFVPGEGLTAFKIVSEYLIIAILLAAAVLVQRKRGSFTTRKYLGIQLALGAMVLSEFCFTLYQNVFDHFNEAGHLLKVFSYWFLFRALVEQTLLQPFTDRSHLLFVLGERLKEMKCLSELARVSLLHEADTPGFLGALVGMLPAAMRYDKLAQASIVSEAGCFGIDPVQLPEGRCIEVAFAANGRQVGTLRVGYPPHAAVPEPLFLDEEYLLLEQVADRVAALLDRQHNRETIQQLNRLYRMLSGVNRAVVHSSSQSRLMWEVFTILRESQSFSLIGIAERADAQSAFDITHADCLDSVGSVNCTAALQQLAEKLWPERHFPDPAPMLLDISTITQPLLLNALHHAGCLQVAIVPVVVGEQMFGLLLVGAPAARQFQPDEVRLLDEMGRDVSFAVSHLHQGQRLLEVEGRVEDTEQRFRNMIEQTMIGVMVVKDGHFVYVNPAFCELTGWDAQALINTRLDEFSRRMAPGEAGAAPAETTLDPGMQRIYDFRRKDGSSLKLYASVGLMPWNGGVADVMIVQDVTEKIRYEQQLREAALLLEELSRQLPGVIYQYRVYPDGRSCFPFATHSLWDIYELLPDDVKDDAAIVLQRLHPEDLEQVKASIAASARDLTLWQDDYRVLLPQQGLRWRSGYARPQRLADGSTLWHGYIEDSTARKELEEELRRSNQMLQRSVTGSLEIISRIMDQRDPYTSGHQRRVGQIARLIGQDMGLDRQAQEMLELTGVVHDVGKIAVPTEILTKPTRLTDIELQIVQSHASAGYEILKGTNLPRVIIDAIHQHHERLDGSGYPQGLKGSEITLEARIIAVADVLESMSSHRPYRPALGVARALQELKQGRGSLYDAAVVDAAVKIAQEGLLPQESTFH